MNAISNVIWDIFLHINMCYFGFSYSILNGRHSHQAYAEDSHEGYMKVVRYDH